jgi:putative GTP pyrophosphokinase
MADQLIESFRSQHALYVAFTKSVDDLLKILLDELGVDIFAIDSSTKSIDALLDDARRQANGDKPSLAAAVNDISSLKIVTFLNEDCDRISAVIRRAFEVDEASSVDKKDIPGSDKFAYRPIRLVVSFGAARAVLPEFKRFAGLKAEIEIRTLLQHAWAAINAKFGYRSEADAPREARRRLYRIGAFLDAADEDFALMWSQRRGGREAPVRRAPPPPAAVNGAAASFDSLDAFMEGSRSVDQLIAIAESVGVALSNRPAGADYSSTFMGTLQLLEIDGFKGAGEQLDRFNRRGEEILTKLGELVDIRDPGATFTRPGFVRLALILSTPKARRTKALKKHPIRNVTEDVVAQLPEV